MLKKTSGNNTLIKFRNSIAKILPGFIIGVLVNSLVFIIMKKIAAGKENINSVIGLIMVFCFVLFPILFGVLSYKLINSIMEKKRQLR